MPFQILYLKHFCVAYMFVCHQSKGSLTFLLESPSSGPFQAAFVTPCYTPPTRVTTLKSPPTIMTPSLLPWTVHSNGTRLPIKQLHKVCTHTALWTCWTCFIEGTQGSCTLLSSITSASCSQITCLSYNLHRSGPGTQFQFHFPPTKLRIGPNPHTLITWLTQSLPSPP